MNQDTGWFNSYDKCGPDQRNHPPSRYKDVAIMPQPNQQPRWEPIPNLPPPVGIGHNIQSLHPYGGGGFNPNQFHPAYTPRPIGSYQSYAPHNSGYNYRNNQSPRMRHGNNFRWQRRNGHDRSRTFPNSSPGNHQHFTPGTSNQEPKMREIETEQPREPAVETQSKILDIRPATTASPASSTTTIHIIEDDDVVANIEPKIEEEDKKKFLMECIDLSDGTDCPEEDLNKFEFESRTKVLDKLCGTMDEAQLIEGLKQFKTILKDQMSGIGLKSRLIQLLTKYILFLGMNYKSLASGFVEEYLDLMEDVIAMFCQVITDFINMQMAENKKTHLVRLSFQIKHVISFALLHRLDSIMHCLFKVQLPSLYLEGHSLIWTDVFLYFLRKSKFDPKHDDLLRIFVAWKRLISIRASKDTEMINEFMFQSLRKTPEELRSSPYLKEFMDKYHDNPRCNVQEMLSEYWKWWKEERPKQHWAGLEEPTYIQLPAAFNLEVQSTNIFLNHSSSETRDNEFSKLFEDRRTGKFPGLTQLGKRLPYGRQNSVFWPSTSSNIFDDSNSISTDFDYYDDNDLVIAEPKVVETVVVDSDDDDDVIFIEDEQELNAQEVTNVVEKTTEDVEKLMEESNINDLDENILEVDTSCKDSVNEELLVNPGTSLEDEVSSNNETSSSNETSSNNETSKNNLKETDGSKNETVIEEMCDGFFLNYPEDMDSSNDENDDLADFPNVANDPEENQDNLPSTSNSKSTDDIFDKWEEEFNNLDPEIPDFFDYMESSTVRRTEKSTLMFAERSVNVIEPPKSPEKSNDKDNTETTCEESSKTETVSPQKEITEIVPPQKEITEIASPQKEIAESVSPQKEIAEIVPEKPADPIPNEIEELPDPQPELAGTSEISQGTKCNGLLGICMQDLREVLNEMEKNYTPHKKDLCLKEVPLILEEPLPKDINLSADSGDLVIDETVNEQTDEEDNLDNSHDYAAIVQAACSDDDNNDFAPTNRHDASELSEFEDGEAAVLKPDLAYDSEEISSPPWEPLDRNEVQEHFDSEKHRLENESLEKQQIDSTSAVINTSSETLSTTSLEVASPGQAVSGILESCQTVSEDEKLFNSTPTELAPESTSTTPRPTSPVNLASPCHNNSDTITIQCQLVLKEEVEEPPSQSENLMAIDENCQLEKYANYPSVVPQRQDPVTELPAQSGSQPYSPPSIRIGNAVSALDENSTMLYTPILQDSQKIQPAIVPDILPQQDLPKQNAVPPNPETSPTANNNHIDKFKIVKVHNPPVPKRLSTAAFKDSSQDIYAVVYGPKTFANSQTTETETPEKPKKKSRRSSTTKDGEGAKSKRRNSNPKVYKGRQLYSEKLAKPLSPQDNGLFEYAFEGPTGKPLWNTKPNMLWEDEDPYESPIAVKSDKQLQKKGTALVPILKKPKFAKDVRDYNQPRLIDGSVSQNEATKKNADSLHYPLSSLIASPSANCLINNTSLFQSIENDSTDYYSNLNFSSTQVYLSADNSKLTPASPFLPEEILEVNTKKLEEQPVVLVPEQYQEPYLSLSKTLFGDSLPTSTEDITFLEVPKISEDLPILNTNFDVYEPPQIMEKQSESIYSNSTETFTNQFYEQPVQYYEPGIMQNPAVAPSNTDIKSPYQLSQKPLVESSMVYQASATFDSKITSMPPSLLKDYFLQNQPQASTIIDSKTASTSDLKDYYVPIATAESKVTSNGLDYFVKAQLPPKKRKLTEEDEMAYYIQKLKEEKEPKTKLEENISYPAQRQMSIADVQRDFPKGVVKTLAARKIYPGDPSAYPDPDYFEYPQGFEQYNDFNNKRSIMNVYINGVRDYSAKYPFCLMIGMGTAGQSSGEPVGDAAAELPINYQVPGYNGAGQAPATPNVQKPTEEVAAAQPRTKRSRKAENVAPETPAPPKRGRGRPRKNPII